jgi:hypothetical protein
MTRFLLLIALLLIEVWVVGGTLASAYRNGYRPGNFAAWLTLVSMGALFLGTAIVVLD